MTSVLIRNRDTEAHREGYHMTTEAEIEGGTCQPRNVEDGPRHQSWGEARSGCLQVFGGSTALLTP